MCFEDARIMFLDKSEGYGQLALKLREGNFTVSGFELIILLIGCNDVCITDKNFFEGVESVLEIIQSQNNTALVVLGATLPSSLDTRPMINTYSFRNDKIAGRCALEDHLEHARPGHHLLGSQGPIPDYFDETGDINELGGDVITRALECKIYSTRLFQRHQELCVACK